VKKFLKLQLFKFEGNKIGLVNLAQGEMSTNGEMTAWLIDYDMKDIIKDKITWELLDKEAVSLQWSDIPESMADPLRKVANKLLDDVEKNMVHRPRI
jgi:hypothetical protein